MIIKSVIAHNEINVFAFLFLKGFILDMVCVVKSLNKIIWIVQMTVINQSTILMEGLRLLYCLVFFIWRYMRIKGGSRMIRMNTKRVRGIKSKSM